MAAKIYTNKDASLAPLKKKTLAVIGFGSQGHAHALNLKDSGLKVIIGLYKKSKSWEVAKKLGFEVMETADAVKAADVIFVATPDTVVPSVYAKDIEKNLTKGKIDDHSNTSDSITVLRKSAQQTTYARYRNSYL